MKKITFNLHFTDFCNFKCKHCFVNKQGKELSLNNIKIIIDKIASYSKENNIESRINLAGGEPLVSKNIQFIIDYIYSKGIEVSIITNGLALSKDFIEQNKSKVSMIGISVDSLHYQTNFQIGRHLYNKTLLENELVEKCLFIKSNGIKLKINTCVMSLNKNEDLHNFFEKVNPDRIKILRVFCEHDENLNYLLISDKEWHDIQLKYSDLKVVFEDNDYMRDSYLIIDSEGNLSKNNLHLNNNSLLSKSVDDCLDALKQVN
ncbi:MAG: viperin family antiviral radical SAM protein [Anaeroplasmataceae bacterium]|nr:viperin family antiviral radical SAM protein [Anaeroplasmataceae bacterium]MDE6414435.1 viperin family antiviral radical SAM protein [Anaeroplasmataceae bacterium]